MNPIVNHSRKLARWLLIRNVMIATMTMPIALTKKFKDIVERHHVCYQVWPIRSNGADMPQVGFAVDIAGTHDHPESSPRPGCTECRVVYEALRELAIAACPPVTDATSIDILPFDRSIHASSRRSYRDDVELRIHVTHRVGTDLPVDACERACLDHIVGCLEEFGARKNTWDGTTDG